MGEAAQIIELYADLGIGLADTSVVVLANRYDTLDVLTLDERHFRVLRGPRDLRSGYCRQMSFSVVGVCDPRSLAY